MIEFCDQPPHILVAAGGKGSVNWDDYSEIQEQLYCMTLEALGWPI